MVVAAARTRIWMTAKRTEQNSVQVASKISRRARSVAGAGAASAGRRGDAVVDGGVVAFAVARAMQIASTKGGKVSWSASLLLRFEYTVRSEGCQVKTSYK